MVGVGVSGGTDNVLLATAAVDMLPAWTLLLLVRLLVPLTMIKNATPIAIAAITPTELVDECSYFCIIVSRTDSVEFETAVALLPLMDAVGVGSLLSSVDIGSLFNVNVADLLDLVVVDITCKEGAELEVPSLLPFPALLFNKVMAADGAEIGERVDETMLKL